MTAPVRWRPAAAGPPVVGDLLVRPLRYDEGVPAGWTLAWRGSERYCYRTCTGAEIVDSSRDVFVTPPLAGPGRSLPG